MKLKLNNAVIGCCVGGIEVEERDDTRETVQFPSQGHEIQFDDPLYDPYLDDNPFNTSPQRSPVPEYTRPAPQPTETIELDDGFADQKEPRYYQIVENLRQENTNCTTDNAKQSVHKNAGNRENPKKDPLPIEVDVTIENSEVPELNEEKKSYSSDWSRTDKSGNRWERRVDKSIEPYRVYQDPDPRMYQELDLGTCDIESPRGFAEVLTGKEIFEEYPGFQYLDAVMPPVPEPKVDPEPEKPPSRFKRFKRFLRRLCCCKPPIKPEIEPQPEPQSFVPSVFPSLKIDDVTTLHVFRTDFETDTGVCRAIRDLRVRRKSCYI